MFYKRRLQKIDKKLDDLSNIILNSKINELSFLLQNNKKIIGKSFLNGLFRGFGTAIGFTILAAIIIYFLQRIVMLNLPIISEYISDIMDIIEKT